MHQLNKLLMLAAALLAVLNGLVIAGNDLLFGPRSSLPMVSGVIAAFFVEFGIFVWRTGTQLHRVGTETPAGSQAYAALSRLMALAFVVVALMMLSVLYALYDRAVHGTSIFG
ncbi:hypothetical protein IOC47_22895 [Enterobacter cloacae]|uniref:hypothetical protein n=1 Tax=Enterobacteriaceae TaxID=543 RepID=UPI000598E57B|nr:MULTISPECIES: hypothetical protein [Enterobacteriaceae]HBM7601048.1 hypothetical protein [Enterobacter asburiae]HBR1984270.1 hypothetical protein [Klebsiella quasipneumoniae subsp. quasipneumoniae]HCI6708509.1 hypothetical protein [Klebsiella quasipneumoniae subsp. similipneumoniae]ELS4527929.1 hypothetical protein [Enterobacter hormaechei]KII59397.1 hypothetical protein SE21_04500 [Klebsiella quasipneumoniae]